MIIVGKHQEGISLNPLDYLLNDDGSLMTFDSIESAKEYIRVMLEYPDGIEEFLEEELVYEDYDEPIERVSFDY